MLASTVLLALAAVAAAKRCENITIPVSLSVRNGLFAVQAPATQFDVTNFILRISRQGINYTDQVFTRYNRVKGDYNLAATYCEPDDGPGETVQVLTHGIGFDRSYWDLPFNNYTYSYVDKAIERGYSTLSWDRLGIGQSSHGDPVGEIQIFLEIAALKALTQQLWGGQLSLSYHTFKKMVHVGHSFGSAITFAFSHMCPDMTNAIILTGFSQASEYMSDFTLGGHFAPVREIETLADHYVDGYIATKSQVGVHQNFFSADDFDPDILNVATVMGQPAAVGELLTIASIGRISHFGGSVLLITGASDIPFCGGDCYNTRQASNGRSDLLSWSKGNFKKASSFDYAIVPFAGHALNYHYSAGSTYKIILDFIQSHL